MKNFTLSLLLGLFIPFLSIAQIHGERLLGDIEDEWLHLSNTLTPFNNTNIASKRSSEYLLIARRSDNWDDVNESWVIRDTTNLVYDSNNNLTLELTKTIQGENKFQYIFEYDSNENLIHRTGQEWNGNSWENYNYYTREYDSDNRLVFWLSQIWDGTMWENKWRYYYEYDSNSDYFIQLIRQEWLNGSWMNQFRNTNEYDAEGNFVLIESENWDGMNWVNDARINFEYDNNGIQIRRSRTHWDGFEWTNFSQTLYEYDNDNNLILYSSERWQNNEWRNFAKLMYQYDENDNRIKSEEHFWLNDDWLPLSCLYYYYQLLSNLSDPEITNVSFSTYPNPTKGLLYIDFGMNLTTEVSIKMFNELGRLVHSEKNQTGGRNITLPLDHLSNGIYFVEVTTGDITTNSSVVIAR